MYFGSGIALIGVLLVGWWLVSPLFLDKTVEEDFPASADNSSENEQNDTMKEETDEEEQTAEEKTEQAKPSAHLTGSFQGADQQHNAEGKAEFYKDEQIIRFTQFQATNGPDLYVYHVKADQDPAQGTSLGKLKGNKGSQNYEIPEGLNVKDGDQIVIWCKAFSVSFGLAELTKGE